MSTANALHASWRRAACVLAASCCFAGCTQVPEPAQFTGPTMGTSYHVAVTDADDPAARERIQRAIDGVLRDVERHLSTYDEASEISLFNRSAGGEWQEVSPTLFAVVQQAREAGELTGGAFDITVAPLLELWSFDVTRDAAAGANEPLDPPDAAQIAAALRDVGPAMLEMRKLPRAAIRKRASGTRLTVDGIAPGYAVDRIAGELRALGHGDFVVELGGEVRAQGERREGGPWRIAIEVPQPLGREPLIGIRLRDAAVSTSGDYRDERIDRAGQRYSHTLDPRTGRPVQGALTSVTVIDPRAARADAYATALMVMGTAAGLEWATQRHVPVLFVERTAEAGEWRIVESPAFAQWRD